MLRPLLYATAAFAAIVSPALAPATASADTCMCRPEGSVVVQGERERTDTTAPESAEVGPFFSSDGAALTSDEATAAPARARRSGAQAPILWCVSADDPRCSPRDSRPHPGSITLDGAHVAASEVPPPRVRSAEVHELARWAPRGGPRIGTHHRLDRPPQA